MRPRDTPQQGDGSRPVFYRWFSGHGYAELADIFRTDDPFALSARQIVERLTAIGRTPDLARPYERPIVTMGVTTRVDDDGRAFIVSVDAEGETIMAQEMRKDDDNASA